MMPSANHRIPAWGRIEAGIGRLGLVLLIGLASLLGACKDPQPDIMPDGRIPIRVYLLLISTHQVEYYAWAEETFEAQNPDFDVIIEQFPGSSLKDFEIKLRLRFGSQQAPDLFHANTNVASELAAMGLLAPVPAPMVEEIKGNSLNDLVLLSGLVNGTYYGITNDGVWTALYYNKDMFREVGLDPERPPATWEELIEYADRLTIRNEAGEPTRSGLSLRTSGFKGGIAEKWRTFLYSAGGEAYTDGGTEALFNSEAGREALGFYHTILFERKIDSVQLEGDQQGFGQRRTAMFIREPHVISWLRENYPDLDFGVAPIPRRDTSISAGGSYMFSVSADSPHPDAAWAFADFLRSDSAYARYTAAAGTTPVTKSVAALPRYQSDSLMQVFLDQTVLEEGGFIGANRASDILGAYIEQFAYGRLTAEETLERAARDVNAVLAPNRRRLAATHAPTP